MDKDLNVFIKKNGIKNFNIMMIESQDLCVSSQNWGHLLPLIFILKIGDAHGKSGKKW